jgi:tetratricopeptide (TPR) repeat protein
MCAALAPFWSEHGHLSEGLGWTQAALALHAADIPAPTRIAALSGAATMAINLSAFDEATTLCASLVPFARQAGSAQDLIAALNTRALLARMQDRYRDAIADYEDALAHAEHVGDAGGRAKALIGLSDVTFFTGDTGRAYELAQLGLAATRAAGNHGDLADALLSFVRQTMHAGDFARTDTLATEALQIRRTHNDIRNQAEALRALGTSATLQQRYERAAHLLEQALALYRNSGDERVAPQLLAHLGQVALDTGDFARAEQLCAESLDVAHRFDDRWAIAMSTTLLGHVDLAMGRVEPAGLRFRDSAEVFEAIGNPLFLSWCLEGVAGVAAARGHYTAAARLCAARDELLSDLSAAIPPAHPDGYRQTLATIDAELGAEEVTAARESVRGVPPGDVIAAAPTAR